MSVARVARPDPIAVGLAIVIAGSLLVAIGADPVAGVTGSRSPFTDEAWNVMNARNLQLLGAWSTDQFNLHLVNGPWNLLAAALFRILGVGLAQARLLSVLAVGLTVLALGLGLRRSLGRWPALLAAAGFGACGLVLYYGRLAYPENLVMLGMTIAALTLARLPDHPLANGSSAAWRWGLLAGLVLGLTIATKANAVFGTVGAMLGLALLGTRGSIDVRRWLGGAVAGLAAILLCWIVLVYLPARDAVAVDLAIWPHQAAPRSIVDLTVRIGTYPFRSDGALPGLLPLGVGAAAGIVTLVVDWRRMPPERRRVAVAAAGWLLVQVGVVVVASYRPNRYLLPALPAAAILLGVAASAVADRMAQRAGPQRSIPDWGFAVAVVGLLVAPGLVAGIGWTLRAGHRLGPMQQAVASIVPAGATVWGGYAPLVAMTDPVRTVVPWPQARANLDRPDPVQSSRWVVTGDHEPVWAAAAVGGASAATRIERACLDWGGVNVCLVELGPGP